MSALTYRFNLRLMHVEKEELNMRLSEALIRDHSSSVTAHLPRAPPPAFRPSWTSTTKSSVKRLAKSPQTTPSKSRKTAKEASSATPKTPRAPRTTPAKPRISRVAQAAADSARLRRLRYVRQKDLYGPLERGAGESSYSSTRLVDTTTGEVDQLHSDGE